MHLLLRTLMLLFTSSKRSPPLGVWEESSLPLRVLPTDIDIAMHVNNGMYFSLMDLGRFDLMVRSGIWTRMRKRGWSPVAAGETIAFRKSLQLWQQYTIETRIIGLDSKAIYFEQRMVVDGEIYARAHIATRLVHKGKPVSQEEIIAEFGAPPAELELPEWIHECAKTMHFPERVVPPRTCGAKPPRRVAAVPPLRARSGLRRCHTVPRQLPNRPRLPQGGSCRTPSDRAKGSATIRRRDFAAPLR